MREKSKEYFFSHLIQTPLFDLVVYFVSVTNLLVGVGSNLKTLYLNVISGRQLFYPV